MLHASPTLERACNCVSVDFKLHVPRTRLPSLHRFWTLLLCLCCIILASNLAFAEVQEKTKAAEIQQRWAEHISTPFQHITREQGLPHGFATAIAEDQLGFIWIGTQGGIARWDGYRFRTYAPNPKDLHSIPDAYIQVLFQDKTGTLWIGTNAGGLSRYDPEHDQFVNYKSDKLSVSHLRITDIIDDPHGGLWVTSEAGLDHFDPTTGQFTHLQHDGRKDLGNPENKIHAIVVDKEQTLWLGSAQGLLRKLKDSNTFVLFPMPTKQTSAPAVWSLRLSSDGSIWVGTRKYGAFQISADRQTIKEIRDNSAQAQLAGEWVHTIKEIQEQVIWIGTWGQGILEVNQKTGQHKRITSISHIKEGLNHNVIYAIHKDRSGLIWVGTNNGLNIHDPKQAAISTVFATPNPVSSAANNDVVSIMEANDGKIWLGLNNNIEIIDPYGGRVRKTLAQGKEIPNDLVRNPIRALYTNKDGNVFIGSAQGLYRSDTQATHFEPIKLPELDPFARIDALWHDGKNIWVGSADEGLWVGNTSEIHAQSKFSNQQISDRRITIFAEGPNQTNWVGTQNGLYQLNRNLDILEKIPAIPNDDSALSVGFITTLTVDKKNRLWIGTFGGGINILDKRDVSAYPHFIKLGLQDGLPTANIGQLLCDHDGNIWASTSDGIAVINPDTFAIKKISRADGMLVQNYWVHSGVVTKQGEILFGGIGGMTIIRPKLLHTNQYQAPVVITELQVNHQLLDTNPFNLLTKTLVIAPDQNNFSVEFAALDYSAPEHNIYAHRLDPVDKDWISTDASRRVLNYTNLAPGEYQLHLRASNRDGIWSEHDRIIKLQILPRWYQTLWFRIGTLIFLILSIGLVIRARTAYLWQQQKTLHDEVRRQTQELANQKQSLQSANDHLFELNQELQASSEVLRELGEAGRDITSNLNESRMYLDLHHHLRLLLRAPMIIIHHLEKNADLLEQVFGRDGDATLKTIAIPVNSIYSTIARAAREKRELILEAPFLPENPCHFDQQRGIVSMLFAPLMTGDRVLGVLSIYSDVVGAYSDRERFIFRSLCAYASIALANIESLHALNQAQDQLLEREKLASLGRLVAGVAHELNTPIGNSLLATTTLNQSTARMLESLESNKMKRSSLQSYLNDAVKTCDLIEQSLLNTAELITSFKQIAVDQSMDNARDFYLKSAFEDTIATLAQPIQTANCNVTLDVPEDLQFHSYPGGIAQITYHLIDNAINHGFENKIAGNIHISANNLQSDTIVIQFSDDGVGIPQKVLRSVFDPFFTTKMGQGGTGLGLTIVYNIVTGLMGGKIAIESQPDQGTRIKISIPKHAPEE